MNGRKEIACPTCLVKPVIAVGRLFGLTLIFDCNCQNVTGQSKLVALLYRLYLAVLEIYCWFNVTNWTLKIFDKGLMCTRSIEVFGEGSYIMNYICAFGFLFNAILRSMFQRKKLRFLQRKSYYAGESERFRDVEKFSMVSFVVIIAILLIIKIGCEMILYPHLIGIPVTPWKALFCTVYISSMISFLYIEIMLFTFQLSVICWLVHKRFEQLSVDFIEIKKDPIDLRWRLNDLMNKHEELLYAIEEMNDVYEIIAPGIYGYFILEVTLCICVILYMRGMTDMVKMLCFSIALILSSTMSVLSFYISRFTGQIYGAFKEMEIFSSANLHLGDKLKLLDFMKRFAKASIGVSVGGFFHIKKNFFIRMTSTVESFLSSVTSLAEEKQAINCSARKSDTTSQWFA